jgi:exopolyphosphatase/guanosine-5'-triphosphate,3'-diphosphate pyrophosphatase
LTDEDPRERTVSSMQRRYHVDNAQAERVEATALAFLKQVAESWDLEEEYAELVLKWAARLHEIGLDVAHSGYHRHGAYLLENADLPGFAREEQLLLARLVGAHRRKPIVSGVEDLIPPWDRLAVYLIALLRLAVLLHRGRSPTALPPIELTAEGRTLELHFPARWLKDHALSAEDLHQEIEHLRELGVKLRVYSGSRTAAA